MPAPRAVLGTAIAASLTAAAMVALPGDRPTATTPAATFIRPMILAGGGAEPSIRVPRDGKSAAYVSAPTGLGSNFWRITEKHNADALGHVPAGPGAAAGPGHRRRRLGDLASATSPSTRRHTAARRSPTRACTTSTCSTTSPSRRRPTAARRSRSPTRSATQNTLTDRQWQVFDGAKTNFLIYHMVEHRPDRRRRSSPTAGQHYVSLGAEQRQRHHRAGSCSPSSGNNQQIGNIIVNHAEPITGATNPVSGEQVHAMYAIFGDRRRRRHRRAVERCPASTYNGIDTIYVGTLDRRRGDVDGHEGLQRRPGDQARAQHAVPGRHVGQQLATSTPRGPTPTRSSTPSRPTTARTGRSRTRSTATTVASARRGVERPDPGKADVFPWIAAGGNGLLDVVWYHGQGGAAQVQPRLPRPG